MSEKSEVVLKEIFQTNQDEGYKFKHLLKKNEFVMLYPGIIMCRPGIGGLANFFVSNTQFSQASQDGKFGIMLQNLAPYMTVETEEFIFPLTSLVAEVGGTLGLFLGFSFMWFWDGVELVADVVHKIKRRITPSVI